MKDNHGITTTGLFVATAAAAAAGAAIKTAVDQYQGASDAPALERAFDALVHEFFTNTDYTTTEDGDSARELCLNKLRSFTTFASQRHKIPKYLTPDGKYGFDEWQYFYTTSESADNRKNWGDSIDEEGRARIAHLLASRAAEMAAANVPQPTV